MHKIGPAEFEKIPFLSGQTISASAVPFSDGVLRQYEKTHILVFTPSIEWLTINGLREKFGMDPSVSEPCMYNQDWYLKEDFANRAADGKWHLIRKDVLDEARAKRPEEIEAHLSSEQFPSAIICAFTFFCWWFLSGGEKLWRNDFVWCSDHDRNGDRIYVGRYEDPNGINKNGFSIHRHLSLRPSFSAAPEISQ